MVGIDAEKIAQEAINAIAEKIKNLNTLNIIVAGKTGVGKSTLINSVFKEKLGEEGYKKTCADNALPVDFEKMSYPDFLEQRRNPMAGIVKKAYQKLCE